MVLERVAEGVERSFEIIGEQRSLDQK